MNCFGQKMSILKSYSKEERTFVFLLFFDEKLYRESMSIRIFWFTSMILTNQQGESPTVESIRKCLPSNQGTITYALYNS